MTHRPLRIAIGVHGRFYAFDIARVLLARGHDVTVFTNYPAQIAARFGLPAGRVRSLVTHGVATRVAAAIGPRLGVALPEAMSHRAFGLWLAYRLATESWDVAHVFSGVAEEALLRLNPSTTRVAVIRASCHIRVQDHILREEALRAGIHIDRPSPWMIAREEREYDLADAVTVLSSFAEKSFLDEGFPAGRLSRYPISVEAAEFRAPESYVHARIERIRRGDPIRVLYVGALSAQKGMVDLNTVAESLRDEPFVFRAVGPVLPETSSLLPGESVTRIPKVPQSRLPEEYAWGDVFLFPTVQDGFSVVLAQAGAGGLPLLTTTNSSGPDIIEEGVNGWVVPIRRPDLLTERLRACHADRDGLARMVRHVFETAQLPSWEDAADGFEQACDTVLAKPKRGAAQNGRPASPSLRP